MEREIEKQINRNFQQVRKRLRKVGLLAIFLILFTVLFVVLASRKAGEVESVSKIVFETQRTKAKIEQTSRLLAEYEDKSEQLSKFFPNERSIVDFVKELERTAVLSSSDIDFTFATERPRRDKNHYGYLTYTLRMTTDLNGLLVFLDRFERLPYMTTIKSIQAQELTDFAEAGKYIVKADVYVAEPFSISK